MRDVRVWGGSEPACAGVRPLGGGSVGFGPGLGGGSVGLGPGCVSRPAWAGCGGSSRAPGRVWHRSGVGVLLYFLICFGSGWPLRVAPFFPVYVCSSATGLRNSQTKASRFSCGKRREGTLAASGPCPRPCSGSCGVCRSGPIWAVRRWATGGRLCVGMVRGRHESAAPVAPRLSLWTAGDSGLGSGRAAASSTRLCATRVLAEQAVACLVWADGTVHGLRLRAIRPC